MVSEVIYKAVVIAAKARVANGEKAEDVVAAYNKLSKEQASALLKEIK